MWHIFICDSMVSSRRLGVKYRTERGFRFRFGPKLPIISTMTEPEHCEHKEREQFFSAAKLVAMITMLSRLLGMVRDIAIISLLGASRKTDAFWTAFAIPNMFRRLFGEGALSAAFVPVFTEAGETSGWDRARLVLANATALLAMLLATILVIGEVGLAISLYFIPAGSDNALLLQLIMLQLPFMFTVCMLALGAAALQSKGHFAYPAFAPVILNIVLIAAAVVVYLLDLGASLPGFVVLSLAIVLTGILQLVGVVWLLKRVNLAIVPRFRPILDETKRMARLLLPTMIPLGVVQICSLMDRLYVWIMTATDKVPDLHILGWKIAKPLSEGVVVRIYAAERLYNFPLGILAISLATAIFPLFARYAARNDITGLRNTTNRAIRLCIFLGVPAGAALILLAGPSITAIFRHKNFSHDDVGAAAFVLQMYSVGMWAYFLNHILLRAFFAQKDTRTPVIASIWRAAANIVLVAVLVFTPLNAGAVGLATAITSSATVLFLTWVLHRRMGHLGLKTILASIARTAIATVAMAIPMYFISRWWQGSDKSTWTSLTTVIVGGLAGGGVFLAAAASLRCPELRELRGKTTEQSAA